MKLLSSNINNLILNIWYPKSENDFNEKLKHLHLSIIIVDAFLSFSYAKIIVNGRFKLGEETIAKSSYRVLYALDVLNGPFPLAEPFIAQCPYHSMNYAMCVLNGRFELGEPAIKSSYNCNIQYNYFLEERDKIKEEMNS